MSRFRINIFRLPFYSYLLYFICFSALVKLLSLILLGFDYIYVLIIIVVICK